MKEETKTDAKQKISKPMHDLVRLLARIAVDDYLKELQEKLPAK